MELARYVAAGIVAVIAIADSSKGQAIRPGAPDPTKLVPSADFKAAPFRVPATGLIFVRNRWYDPTTGTWITPDPAVHRDSANVYSYGGADPINTADPTGLYEEDFHFYATY